MMILGLTSAGATLESSGGKGANLSRLAMAGFEVPPGFIVATDAYRAYVGINRLEDRIREGLAALSEGDELALDRASAAIRAAFSSGRVPDDLAASIRRAYSGLAPQSEIVPADLPVAVRSSATTEDLPELSFAGQQDTYLNVIGLEQLLRAVVDCWSSLWTARAIGYRLRNNISQDEVSLAVIVQEMVESDSSGVLFTANPLTGLRNETVIDATLGLGEALVSGQVEPDHYVVNTASGEIVSKHLGVKGLAIRGKSGGGTETIEQEAASLQALPDDEIRRLAALGSRVRELYGAPQDMEWALAGGKLYLLQSRPITSLFPLPEAAPGRPEAWFSFGAVQGVLGPITPLGSDTFRCVFAGGASIFHVRVGYDEQRVLVPAGERLWVKFSDVLRNPLGARVMGTILPMLEPSVTAILTRLADDPGLAIGKGKFRPSTGWRLLSFAIPVLGRMLFTLLRPEQAREAFDRLIERELEQPAPVPAGDAYARLAQRIDYLNARMARAFPVMLPRFIPLLGCSLAMLNVLNRLGDDGTRTSDHGFSPLVLELTRGLPNNVTTEMDLALWQAAKVIRADKASLQVFSQLTAPELASHYLGGGLPPVAHQVVAGFLSTYGMRAVGEIDIGQPRWSDDPTPVMQSLQSYLEIASESTAPDVVFARGRKAAEAAVETLAATVRKQRARWFKTRLVRFAARRVRVLLGFREAPKFFAVRMIGTLRRQLLESSMDLVANGTFEHPDDLFYLHLSELRNIASGAELDVAPIIKGRREAFARESRRRQVPRVMLSDGRTFYEGLGPEAGTGQVLTGSPVSPGVVEGAVRIVLDPHETRLAPGEILVCPGTDPAWTPLFMAAGGLITEVGGMMTHGSVVAREYGIPAVVGVDQATRRLKDGQRIRLDGTLGQILVVE
jgi:phosphohistidine swiveling domain-containing protein